MRTRRHAQPTRTARPEMPAARALDPAKAESTEHPFRGADMQQNDCVDGLMQAILTLIPAQKRLLDRAMDVLTPEDRKELAAYVCFHLDSEQTLEDLAHAYKIILNDTVREQMYFTRKRKYRYSSFKEVADSVYFNPTYMNHYMVGLALTLFLWPNHLAIKHFFDQHIPSDQGGDYLEIGPGHGFYFISAMRRCAYDAFYGVDVSPTSIALTRRLLDSGYFGQFRSHGLIEADFMDWTPARPPRAVVMGEVLEHVEQPWRFFRKIAEIAADDAWIFVTTCVNSPAVDHIHLYEHPDQILSQAREAGLGLVQQLFLPYGELDIEETLDKRLPLNVALILEKAR